VFRFIHAEKAIHDVKTMCRMLGVSRSGFYAWRSRPPSARAVCDQELLGRIKLVHEGSRRTYGAPRIWAELRDEGVRCGRKRVARLMRNEGIRGLCRRRKRRRYAGPRALHPAGDLVRRDFRTTAPNLIWVADITDFPTAEGPLHVAAVMDLFSRALVGWSMASHLRAELVIDALEMAAIRRRPEPGLVHHSDQGPQYTSYVFGRHLREAGILQSMGRTGTPADNAVIESFFDTMKLELLSDRRYRTREEAKAAIFEWIEVFYNRLRRHSTIGYLSPAEFERRYAAQLAV
jgi:transposase InsO family protein